MEPGNMHNSSCDSGKWIKGECGHGSVRWVYIPCKRRDCPPCGSRRRGHIAARINQGIVELGASGRAAWWVGTFDRDVSKPEAVATLGRFMGRVRRRLGAVEYVATWEITRRDRLHVNVIMSPWKYVPQEDLCSMWVSSGGGGIGWIESVDVGIGYEASKWRATLSEYLSKFDQQVTEGRSVSYSRGWPALKQGAAVERQGSVMWSYPDPRDVVMMEHELLLGHWEEVDGERRYLVGYHACDCFERKIDVPTPEKVLTSVG